MKYFYIDSTSSFLYAGIVKDNEILAEINKEMGHEMSEKTLLLIEEMFNSVDLQFKDIDKIILVNGPGSFTGTRIGVTIAKTMAWTLKIPITTISSLFAMAISTESENFKVPLIDARREHVYSGVYDKDDNIIMPEQYIAMNVLKLALEKLGDYDFIAKSGYAIDYKVNILKIVNKVKDYPVINPHAVDANYLKLTEAEENKNAA